MEGYFQKNAHWLDDILQEVLGLAFLSVYVKIFCSIVLSVMSVSSREDPLISDNQVAACALVGTATFPRPPGVNIISSFQKRVNTTM